MSRDEEELRKRADARLDEALRERNLQDPRAAYRQRLRALRGANPELFARALSHYEAIVLPGLAGDADPIETWIEYGRFLAELLTPGRTIAVDRTGRAHRYEPPPPSETLVLHLPEAGTASALPLAHPIQPSAPQLAAYNLLVLGKQEL